MRMGLSIYILRGHMWTFPNKYVLQSLSIALIIANSADPDEMQHYAAFHFGHHCFPNTLLQRIN